MNEQEMQNSTQEQQAYRAVFFDLDGTLLPMELDDFMRTYFGTLGAYVAQFGVTPEDFMAGMKAGIKAMAAHDDGLPNSNAFWEAFFTHVDRTATNWEEQLNKYYDQEFGKIGANVTPNPAAARAIEALAEKGYPLVLTTMPMFPKRAVEWRLTWAGIDPSRFLRITSFNNSTTVKPKLGYYAENLAAAGVAGKDVLMVGNNTLEDLAIQELGADAFLVTDLMLDPINFDVETVKHGSLEEFANWVEQLPACANPATHINADLIPAQACQQALAENGCASKAAPAAEFTINGIEG